MTPRSKILYDPRGEILTEVEAKGAAVGGVISKDTLPSDYHGFVIERKWIGQLEPGGITAGWVRLVAATEEARQIAKRAGAAEVLGCSGEISPHSARLAKSNQAGPEAEEIFIRAFVAAAIEIRKFVRP